MEAAAHSHHSTGGGAQLHTLQRMRAVRKQLCYPSRCAYSAVPVGWGTMILAAREGSTKGTCSWTASWLQPQRTAHEQQQSSGSPPAGLQLVPRVAHPQRRPLHIHLCILGKMGARSTLPALRRRRPPLCSTHQSGQHKGGATHGAATAFRVSVQQGGECLQVWECGGMDTSPSAGRGRRGVVAPPGPGGGAPAAAAARRRGEARGSTGAWRAARAGPPSAPPPSLPPALRRNTIENTYLQWSALWMDYLLNYDVDASLEQGPPSALPLSPSPALQRITDQKPLRHDRDGKAPFFSRATAHAAGAAHWGCETHRFLCVPAVLIFACEL